MRFLFLMILIYPLSIDAQKVESVELQLKSLQSDSAKIEFLNNWSGKNYRKKPKEAWYYAEQTIQLSKISNNFTGLGDAQVRLALILLRRGELNESLSHLNEAIANFTTCNDSLGINRTLLNRGLIYKKKSLYQDALKDFFKSHNYFEQRNNFRMLSLLQNNIGLVYKELKDYKKANTYYTKSLSSCNKGNKPFLYSVNNNIANLHSIQGKYKESLEYYQKNLNLLKEKPNKYKKAQTLHNLGNTFMYLKQYELALEYFEQSLQLKEQIGNKNFITTTLNSIADNYYRINNFSKALQYSTLAYNTTLQTNNLALRRTSAKDLFHIYAHLKKPDSSIRYSIIWEELKDSLLNKENLKQIAEIETKYETEKKEAQIALLEKENRIKKMQRNVLTVFAILLLGFLFFVLRSFFKNKKVTRLLRLQKMRIEWHRELLHQRNVALQQTNQTKNKLFQIISHDLRSPLASVSGIAKLIPMFIKKERYDILPSTSQDLEESVSRVLNLTDNLLSWSMNQAGRLPHNPEIICVHKIVASNMDTYLSVAKQKNIHLEMWTAQNLFVYADRYMLETVMRNLINNAIKFTPDGGVILIDAKQTVEHTEIRVKDSGVGIPADRIPKLFEVNNNKSNAGTRGEAGNGLGLILCKEFVERNSGTIWAESTEGMGATFHFTVPNAEKIAETDAVQMKMDLGK